MIWALSGAYPTGMSMINYADWDKQITIPKMSGTEFINKYGEYLIRSFTAIKVEFTFPNNVVFPNLPVRLDKGSLMYPLSGQSFCTGLEILLAHRLGCQFIVLGGSFIPFINTPAALTLYREQSDLTMDLKAEQTVSVRNLNKTIKTLETPSDFDLFELFDLDNAPFAID